MRRRRLNEPRGGRATSDQRVDAFRQDCEREDLATQLVVLASVRTNDSTIKERACVRQSPDHKNTGFIGSETPVDVEKRFNRAADGE